MRTRSTITAQNGLTYYYEQEGSGPDVVLIPDGLGECQFFDKGIPQIAAAGFKVTTFDMPGMSRSGEAPVETYTEVTSQKLATYVISFLDALGISQATIWGCSSGAATVLVLCKDYPERVRNAFAHEVPDVFIDGLSALRDLDDEAICNALEVEVVTMSAGDEAAWKGLGEEAHIRLRKNYPRWARGYPLTIPTSSPTSASDLQKVAQRPLVWSVGATTPMGRFFTNVVAATKAGIELKLLPGGHLMYISHPDAFASHIVDVTKKYI